MKMQGVYFTGWAWLQREKNFGIPNDCDAAEGWIVDPRLNAG